MQEFCFDVCVTFYENVVLPLFFFVKQNHFCFSQKIKTNKTIFCKKVSFTKTKSKKMEFEDLKRDVAIKRKIDAKLDVHQKHNKYANISYRSWESNPHKRLRNATKSKINFMMNKGQFSQNDLPYLQNPVKMDTWWDCGGKGHHKIL